MPTASATRVTTTAVPMTTLQRDQALAASDDHLRPIARSAVRVTLRTCRARETVRYAANARSLRGCAPGCWLTCHFDAGSGQPDVYGLGGEVPDDHATCIRTQ